MNNICFQQKNVNWIVEQYKKGFNRLLIADETGLGKTITTVGAIYELAGAKKRMCANSKKSRFRVLYVCSNPMIAKKNMKELAQKLYEKSRKESGNVLISKKAARVISGRKDERLSLLKSSDDIKDSFVEIRNATAITSFCKSHPGGTKEERDALGLSEEDKRFWQNREITRKDISGEPEKKKYEEKSSAFFEARKKLTYNNLKEYEFDLIVLDEFQSYEYILNEAWNRDGSKNSVNVYIDELFGDTKILLLSATPYRIDGRELSIDKKFEDFKRVLGFLEKNSTLTNLQLTNSFEQYSKALGAAVSFDELVIAKEKFETQFKNYCRRNQRIYALSNGNDFYETTIVYSQDGEYKDCYDAESKQIMEHMLINAKLTGDGEEGELELETEAYKSKALPVSYSAKCPWPIAFSKGYKAWDNEAYNQITSVYPFMQIESDTADKHKGKVTGFRFEEDVIPSVRFDVAKKLIEQEMGDSVFKMAWLPPAYSKNKPMGWVWKEVHGKNISKLLSFGRWKCENRSLAAALSSLIYKNSQDTISRIKKYAG